MKFIVDNQLPVALAEHLRKLGFDCQHVLDVNLSEALDSEICRYAELEGRIIISKDEDFFYLAKQLQARIRVIWVRMGKGRTSALTGGLAAILDANRVLPGGLRRDHRTPLNSAGGTLDSPSFWVAHLCGLLRKSGSAFRCPTSSPHLFKVLLLPG